MKDRLQELLVEIRTISSPEKWAEFEGILNEVDATTDLDELEHLRVKYLGRKGIITVQVKEAGRARKKERKILGVITNIEMAYQRRLEELA